MNFLHRFKKISYFLQYLYDKVTKSIAFLPSLMAIGFLCYTGFMIHLERNGLTAWMEEQLPIFFVVKSWDVASSVLTTLIGALISLMVFSFSMVMVLLNNAASNYSPRILPGLIADRFHQFVLGTYLGTIIYCIILVINMTPTQDKVPLPSFSVLFGIFLGVTCLLLFVLFIHSISESVQVGKILEKLHNNTISKMSKEKWEEDTPTNNNITTDRQMNLSSPFSEDWMTIDSDRSGHLHTINRKDLHQLCEQENIQIKMLLPESRFILEGSQLFAVDKPVDEKTIDKILEKFDINTYGLSNTDYVVGFKFITEIAIKAMSPGINDPGTAISAIDYLTILFSNRMELPDHGAVHIYSGKAQELQPVRLWLEVITFDELLTFVLAPIRQYAKHDVMVTIKLIEMLIFLDSREYCNKTYRQIIQREALVIQKDAKKHLTNKADYNRVATLLEKIFTISTYKTAGDSPEQNGF